MPRPFCLLCSRFVSPVLLGLILGAAHAGPASAELSSVRSQILQKSPTGTLPGTEGPSDYLGHTVAKGDFNGDGFDDLAAFENATEFAGTSGAVHLIYGGADGLSAAADQRWYNFDPETLIIERQAGDLFGWALAAGDFNGDGFDDLAAGVPGEDIETAADTGAVLVIYGSELGLQNGFEPGSIPARRFELGSGGVGGGPPTSNESFGAVLVAADFSGDGRDDLAVGIPEKSSGTGEVNAGQVLILWGTSAGLTSSDHVFLDQDSNLGGTPMVGTTLPGDHFGESLAAGDFDGNGVSDLAIGVPFEDGDLPGCPPDSGAVQIVYGLIGGLVTTGNQLWYEGNVATSGSCEINDRFGIVLAAGDLTGDGVDDLVIGAPLEDVGAIPDAGAITFMIGLDETGISTPGSELFVEQDFSGFGNSQAEDHFGAALAIGDFIEDIIPGRKDLAIGVPSDNVWNAFSTVPDVGSVIVTIGGSALGPSSGRIWAPGLAGVAGALVTDQEYGKALVAGDFDGNGHADLAIGAPFLDSTENASGALYILQGALFSDGFESHSTAAWSTVLP